MATTYNSSSGGSSSVSNTHSESLSQYVGKVDPKTQLNKDKYAEEYKTSAEVNAAYQQLQNTLNSKPSDFQSSYQNQLNNLYDKIINREQFKYDMNSDALYQQYKNQYQSQGKTAMKDTMAQAASLTGGYGSSYSQTAGQQTYQNYLDALNERVPELYQLALQKYQYEGQEMRNNYDMTADAYDREYGQYRDTVADYQADRNYFQNAYSDERNFDYGKYSDNRNYWTDEFWNERKSAQKTVTDSTTVTNGSTWSGSTSISIPDIDTSSSKSSSSSASSSQPVSNEPETSKLEQNWKLAEPFITALDQLNNSDGKNSVTKMKEQIVSWVRDGRITLADADYLRKAMKINS